MNSEYPSRHYQKGLNRQKIKDKDIFSYGDLLVLFKLFDTPAEKVVELMQLDRRTIV